MVRTWAQSNPFQPYSYQICEGYVWVLPVQVPVHSKPYSALLVGLGMGQREVWDCHCRQCEALHLSKSRSGQCPRRDILASHFRTGRQWEAGLSSHPCSKWALSNHSSPQAAWPGRGQRGHFAQGINALLKLLEGKTALGLLAEGSSSSAFFLVLAEVE